MWTKANTHCATWFERDRASVVLYAGEDENAPTLLEWWDDDVRDAVEDGFLNPLAWHESAVWYANHIGATPVNA